MRVLGIDFGMSNTVGMLRLADGRLRPLLFDGSPLLPSAVYLGTDGRMLVGRDAERNARLDISRFEPHPKSRVDDGYVLLGDRELSVEEVFGFVLGHVATEARRQLGKAPDEVRLTHPARWGEGRRGVLVAAARQAGLGTPRLIPEPVGAASYFTAVHGAQVPVGRSLAIYDLGGGTFDATVVRRTQTGFDVLAEEGLQDVGGLDFDHAIVEHLGTSYGASHGGTWDKLVNPTDSNDRRQRRMLYEDVRGAKEMLSRTTNADIHIPALEVDAHLTRDEFENLVRPYLDRTIQCLQRAIAAARVQPQELTGIFLVGGSSRIPLAAHMIHTALGVAPTTLEQPETVVVEGALCIGAARPPGPGMSGAPRSGSAASGPPVRRPIGQQPVGCLPFGVDTAMRPASQQRPPAAEPAVRHLVGEMPSRVRLGREFSLIVEILSRPAPPDQRSQPLSVIADRRGTPLWIIVRVGAGLEVLANSEETMLVWPDRDSTPVRFALRARAAGMHTVRVSAWSGGTFLAELSLQTSASADRVDADPRRVSVAVDSMETRTGEVTLLVEVEGGRYSYRWLTEGFLSRRALAEPLVGPPDAAVSRTVETLRRIVQQESGYSTANARRWVTETGVGLWQEMVPDPIKDQFWELRGAMRALYIACADDWMPWELLYPRAPRRDEGFLVQQLPVLRQVPDQHHPAVVRLEGAHCVVPPRSPSNAKHEADVVRRALGAAGVDGISDHDIESLDDLLLMLDSGTTGLLHFACHNGYSVEAGGSFIRMVGGNFVPALLNSIRTDSTLAHKNPLIFLNACSSAGIAPYYTRIMGWAEQFMSAGAGAFIGTLWPVETHRAATFAEVFYTNLLAGQTLGNASLQARRTIEDPADPSWLAYTIYGNPNAVASLGH